ncbi:hypothetical protein [Phenylobacterium sp.]|uniref:hypothetical protein n=1 Tax=Phenylobacterium sp. TaxID=1871053 RepID=UPI002FC6C1CA
MSITQFLRIFWAHRWLPFITTSSSFLGALIVVMIVAPSYEANSRVMLNLLKPDPVTGEVIGNRTTGIYVQTQMELIKDYGVAGKVVDQLGWMNDPGLMAQYQASGSTLDMRRWLAQRIIDATTVKQVSATNFLEIGFRSASPEQARATSDALRAAYLESVLESRREDANRNAEWFTQQAAKLQEQVATADQAKTEYERENGIIMQSDNTDVDTARLRALAGQGAGISMAAPVAAVTATPSEMALTQIDAQASQLSKILGPNHPQMAELNNRRSTLEKLAARERAAQQSAAAAAAGGAAQTAAAIDRAVQTQTSRVIAKRDKIQRLTQLQTEVNMRREQYNRASARAAEYRQEAAVTDPGMSPMGNAVTPRKPTFPNIPLILGGASALGFVMGLMVALLLELLGRRIRSVEDMRAAFDVPLLAVVKATALKAPRRSIADRRFLAGSARMRTGKRAVRA